MVNKLKVGMQFKLRRDTDKSDWGIDLVGAYDKPYTISSLTDRYHDVVLDETWYMELSFLKEHFKPVKKTLKDMIGEGDE